MAAFFPNSTMCEQYCLYTPGCVLAAYSLKDTEVTESRINCQMFEAEEISKLNFEFKGNNYNSTHVEEYQLTFLKTCQLGGKGNE